MGHQISDFPMSTNSGTMATKLTMSTKKCSQMFFVFVVVFVIIVIGVVADLAKYG